MVFPVGFVNSNCEPKYDFASETSGYPPNESRLSIRQSWGVALNWDLKFVRDITGPNALSGCVQKGKLDR